VLEEGTHVQRLVRLHIPPQPVLAARHLHSSECTPTALSINANQSSLAWFVASASMPARLSSKPPKRPGVRILDTPG
jgi:hypothetical protein